MRAARDAESAQMAAWIDREDDFHLEQAKKRAEIRVRERRAKPIDYLALNLKWSQPPLQPGDEGYDEDDEDEGEGLEVDLEEPYAIFEVRPLPLFRFELISPHAKLTLRTPARSTSRSRTPRSSTTTSRCTCSSRRSTRTPSSGARSSSSRRRRSRPCARSAPSASMPTRPRAGPTRPSRPRSSAC